MSEPLLDDDGASAYLKVTTRHLRSLRYNRAIPYIKVGRLVRYSRVELDAWAAKNTVKAER
jgi:excisionase family DNA binding protein